MPSQEEYLDQLLKGITNEPIVEEPAVEEPIIEDSMNEEPVMDVPDVEEVLQEPVFDALMKETVLDETDIFEERAEFDDDILKKMVLENATIEEVLDDEDDEPIMSEEEVEAILAANQSGAESDETEAYDWRTDEDLMELLGQSSDNELQDIYDMLHKAEHNEVVDEEVFANNRDENPMDEAAALQAILDGDSDSTELENGTLSEREKQALEKKRLKEEKAEAKKAAKEAKKAEKEAKKAEKQAQKAANKAAKSVADENAEAAATPIAAGADDLYESIDELSTADMLDLQDLLSFADIATPSEDAIAQLQQSAKAQTRPVMVEVPESAIKTVDLNEPTEADMQEIDELLSLAGITELTTDDVLEFETLDGSSVDIQQLDEEIRDITPAKEKKGFFARIIDFLTETDEDDLEGTEDIPLSDENRNILEEMDKEGKGSGKKKGKKAKKGKKEQAELPTLEDEDAPEAAAKSKKNKQSKKNKKDKKAKKEEHLKVMPLDEPKKLPVKALVATSALCATILVLILLLVNLGGDFAQKREAKKAYYREDYETCYQTLYGKELNESEQVMFARSESILRIRLRMRQYEVFAKEQSEVEALDVLIQTVYEFEDLYQYASKWNAGDEVSAVYMQILDILQNKYRLSESDALEIAAQPDDVEYTKIVTAVAEGGAYHAPEKEQEGVQQLPDMLPEELQFPENNGGR